MRIDWNTARVKSQHNSDVLTLHVRLVDIGGNAYYEAFAHEARALQQAVGTDRRNVHRSSTGSSGWGIEVSPIDGSDIEGEKQLFDEFVERVNRRAEPAQAKLDDEDRRERDERAAREKLAAELTDRFKQFGDR